MTLHRWSVELSKSFFFVCVWHPVTRETSESYSFPQPTLLPATYFRTSNGLHLILPENKLCQHLIMCPKLWTIIGIPQNAPRKPSFHFFFFWAGPKCGTFHTGFRPLEGEEGKLQLSLRDGSNNFFLWTLFLKISLFIAHSYIHQPQTRGIGTWTHHARQGERSIISRRDTGQEKIYIYIHGYFLEHNCWQHSWLWWPQASEVRWTVVVPHLYTFPGKRGNLGSKYSSVQPLKFAFMKSSILQSPPPPLHPPRENSPTNNHSGFP